MRFMDLLATRYASPFFILDHFMDLGELHNFVNELGLIVKEEEKEKYRWEFFLHKVNDKTYSEFLNMVDRAEKGASTITQEEQLDIIESSRNVLNLY